MKSPGILERLDDALNPIVVKELRQAVQSRFVTWVLMVLLGLQLLVIGIYLMLVVTTGQAEAIDFQAGREVFAWLQGILLATCMLFLPLYAGIRLAAEHSEANTDLLFITTLPPRAIISGKLISSVIMGLLIFSACTPFMAFTYFLRGIDWPSIILIITGDFLVVICSVQLMLFLAVVPANRLLKAFLGLIGFGLLVWIFSWTLMGSMVILWENWLLGADASWFWAGCGMFALTIVGFGGLLFTWSVALISPPSSNRALQGRVYMLVLLLVSAGICWWLSDRLDSDIPLALWSGAMFGLAILSLMIAINERETWTPRTARSIPRAWWARPFALLFFSGAAGGVLFSALLVGLNVLAVYAYREFGASAAGPFGMHGTALLETFQMMGTLTLYLGCYALTAVFVRYWLLRSVAPGYTWIIMLVLVALGSLVPFLVLFATVREFSYANYYPAFFGNPVAAVAEFFDRRTPRADEFLAFASIWAGVVIALNAPWFLAQIRRFRPPAENGGVPLAVTPSAMTAYPLDSTQTAPSA